MFVLNLSGQEELCRQLVELIRELNTKGVQVQFWKSSYEQNIAARRLARQFLDGILTVDASGRSDEALPEEYVEQDRG